MFFLETNQTKHCVICKLNIDVPSIELRWFTFFNNLISRSYIRVLTNYHGAKAHTCTLYRQKCFYWDVSQNESQTLSVQTDIDFSGYTFIASLRLSLSLTQFSLRDHFFCRFFVLIWLGHVCCEFNSHPPETHSRLEYKINKHMLV